MDDETEVVDNKKRWPAWRYGPNGASEIFQNEDEVPDGWQDHPSKIGGKTEKPRDPVVNEDSPYKDKTDAEVIEQLQKRHIEHGARWPRNKLEALLIADDKKKAK